MPSISEPQMTFAKSAAVSGTSLHTGEKVTLKVQPAPPDSGIKFRRKDLQEEPTIDATHRKPENGRARNHHRRRLRPGAHRRARLAALSAMGVDNAIVEMDANEPPIGDGSALPFVELIKKAGVVAQEMPRRFFDVREPLHVESKTGAMIVLLPDDKFRISCTQAGPNGRFTQFFSTEISPAIFEQEIAPARTFVFYEDVQPLMEKNLIKGGSLENAVVVRGDAVMSKEPLRFPDEFVAPQNSRHHRRSRADRTTHSRPCHRGETGSRRECRTRARDREGTGENDRDVAAATISDRAKAASISTR